MMGIEDSILKTGILLCVGEWVCVCVCVFAIACFIAFLMSGLFLLRSKMWWESLHVKCPQFMVTSNPKLVWWIQGFWLWCRAKDSQCSGWTLYTGKEKKWKTTSFTSALKKGFFKFWLIPSWIWGKFSSEYRIVWHLVSISAVSCRFSIVCRIMVGKQSLSNSLKKECTWKCNILKVF